MYDFCEEATREFIGECIDLVDEGLHQGVVLHAEFLHVLQVLGLLHANHECLIEHLIDGLLEHLLRLPFLGVLNTLLLEGFLHRSVVLHGGEVVGRLLLASLGSQLLLPNLHDISLHWPDLDILHIDLVV